MCSAHTSSAASASSLHHSASPTNFSNDTPPTKTWAAVIALLFFLLLLARAGHSQSPAWQWAAQSNGAGVAQVKDIAVDAAGNSYIVGFFNQPTRFGAAALTSQGRSDIFAAKLSSAGIWEWAVAVGGTGSDRAAGVAVDASGHIFITGNFSNQVSFGTTVLTSQGNTDAFVAQLNEQGQWLWATAAGGPGQDRACALTVSSNGELLVAGQYAGTATFGTNQLMSSGSADAFVARLTRGGLWQWATAGGGTDNDEATALTTNAAGEIYVTGYFSNTGTFGASVLTGQGIDDAFVAKLTSAGRWQWATAATGSNTAYGKAIVADPTGGVFVTGSFNGTAAFGNTHLQSNSSDDGFVARLTDAGQWQWVSVLASDYLESIAGIALDKMGKLYVAGTFSRTIRGGSFRLTSSGRLDMFVGYISRTGAWLGLTAGGGAADDETQALALAPSGEVYVGGGFSTAAAFGSTRLQSATPNVQVCVARATVPQP